VEQKQKKRRDTNLFKQLEIQAENHGVEISEEDINNSMVFESLIYDISNLKIIKIKMLL
jgi:hypothetical protein